MPVAEIYVELIALFLHELRDVPVTVDVILHIFRQHNITATNVSDVSIIACFIVLLLKLRMATEPTKHPLHRERWGISFCCVAPPGVTRCHQRSCNAGRVAGVVLRFCFRYLSMCTLGRRSLRRGGYISIRNIA